MAVVGIDSSSSLMHLFGRGDETYHLVRNINGAGVNKLIDFLLFQEITLFSFGIQ